MTHLQVLVIPADRALPIETRTISSSLKSMQRQVGGYIEHVRLWHHSMIMVADEEGLLKQKPVNERASHITGQLIVGDVFICGSEGENYLDVPQIILDIAPNW